MAASGGKEMEIAIKIAGKVESSFKSAIGAATKGLGSITKAVSAATAAAAAAAAAAWGEWECLRIWEGYFRRPGQSTLKAER